MSNKISISPEDLKILENSIDFQDKVNQLLDSGLISQEVANSSDFKSKLINQMVLEKLYPTGIIEDEPISYKIDSMSPGLAILQKAREDLNAGVHEDLGKNDGKRIREYFKHFGMNGGQEWCAAAVSAWMRESGINIIEGSVGAQEIGRQFQSKNRWIPKDKIKPEHLQPGNIVVWSRGEPGSWKGHVGVIDSSDDTGKFKSIEGNSGNNSAQVALNSHSMHDANLLGVGIVSNNDLQSNANIEWICKVAAIFEKICLIK